MNYDTAIEITLLRNYSVIDGPLGIHMLQRGYHMQILLPRRALLFPRRKTTFRETYDCSRLITLPRVSFSIFFYPPLVMEP